MPCLDFILPEGDFAHATRETPLTEELDACEGLGLVAMIEARCGRTFRWETELRSVGNLLDYLALQGVELE